MKKLFTNLLMVLGTLTFIAILYAGSMGLYLWITQGQVPAKTILEMNIEDSFPEYIPDDPITYRLLGKHPTLKEILDGLETASRDDRVIGLVARIGQVTMGPAQIQEFREAVRAFRLQGKKTVAYADTFGEFGPGNAAYYLATAFEKIYLQPSGDIGLTGLMFETRFLKGTLDKLGIIPRLDHRREYKNAMNVFTESRYTEPHRQALESVMMSIVNQIVRDIAKARKLSEPVLCTLIDNGPFLGREAVESKLVDGLAYRDQVYDTMKEEVGGDASLLYFSKYMGRSERLHRQGDKIALIYGVGGIRRGESRYNPLFGDQIMGSKDVSAAFRAAVEDKDVKAIIFRVNSPGGSYVASDTIWRETLRAREAGKPIIVSMSDVAGSGGYFVSMMADKIVAQPGTITGSIGVVAGKMVTSEFFGKLGVSFDEIHFGANAPMWSSTQDYTPDQWERVQQALDRIYEDFTEKVAKGRNMPKEKVLEIAKGRIWTGEDAQRIGLVDELGGFPTAVRLAKQASSIPDSTEIILEVFPKRKSLLERLLKKGADSSEDYTETTVAEVLKQIQPVMRQIRADLNPEEDVLSMPTWEVCW